jgi:hypothetical protein
MLACESRTRREVGESLRSTRERSEEREEASREVEAYREERGEPGGGSERSETRFAEVSCWRRGGREGREARCAEMQESSSGRWEAG